MTWAAIVKGLLEFFNSLFDFVRSQRSEDLGRLKAEKEGRESADAILDAFDRVDAGRLPKPKDGSPSD